MTWSDRRYDEDLYQKSRSSSVVKSIIIATVVVWVLLGMAGGQVQAWALYYLALDPRTFLQRFFIWQPFTYVFIHESGAIFHVLFNMLCLWWLGQSVEGKLGSRRFAYLYFCSGAVAGLCHCAFMPNAPVVGASGAVMGVLVAFAVLFPEATILFMFIFPMKAKHMAMLLIGIDLFYSIAGSGGKVAHLAHLGGAAFGLVFLKFGPLMGTLRHGTRSRKASRRTLTEQAERQRVDHILDKINDKGMASLSRRERNFLRKASKHYQERTGLD